MNKNILVIGIIFLFIGMSITSSTENLSKTSSVCKPNHPPYEPSNPDPSNGYTNNTICPPNLSWSGGDPDGDNVTYDVCFGIFDPQNEPPLVAWNITTTWYQLFFKLEFSTKYEWKIVAKDEYGLITSGEIWIFTTEKNLPPYKPRRPFPENGAKCVPLDIIFCWIGGDPNPCDTVTYDVYFGLNSPPIQKGWNLTGNCWDTPYDLILYQTYYWKVVSWDSQGESTEGDIWKFTTGGPWRPTDPIIDGPNVGIPNQDYTFTFVSITECNMSIRYHIKWGDNSEVEVTDFYEPGVVVSLNHTWEKMGEFWIEAMAEDEHGAESNWARFNFIVPRNKDIANLFLLKLSEQFPLLEVVLSRIINL